MKKITEAELIDAMKARDAGEYPDLREREFKNMDLKTSSFFRHEDPESSEFFLKLEKEKNI